MQSGTDRRVHARRRGMALAALISFGGAVLAFGVSAGPAGAQPTTETFDEVGTFDWVVPADVCSATFEVSGAQGGDGGEGPVFEDSIDTSAGGPGALGGRATATITVTPGETIQINVGGQGETGEGEGDGVLLAEPQQYSAVP